uniref:Uncharacterized protein n=1 Tax=Aegilops tauschii subsp. strangulata TaxID=200361 RepID=A0A453GSW0_AEGTS
VGGVARTAGTPWIRCPGRPLHQGRPCVRLTRCPCSTPPTRWIPGAEKGSCTERPETSELESFQLRTPAISSSHLR